MADAYFAWAVSNVDKMFMKLTTEHKMTKGTC
jgi:hypothetical protein